MTSSATVYQQPVENWAVLNLIHEWKKRINKKAIVNWAVMTH